MRRIILPSVACLALSYFSTLSHKRHDFREKKNVTEHKLCILICSTTFISNIFDSKKNSAEYKHKRCTGIHVKCPSLESDLNVNRISSTKFRKIFKFQNFTKIRHVRAELFHTDGRTGMTKPTVAFRNVA